ncbi:MAG: acyl-CoA thioesterase [Rugosibacter sp.]|nr:acyl-CoA thioesterase [Rugosibacter sp.]
MTTQDAKFTPPQGALELRVVPMPSDVNGGGDIFGGWVMAQVDIAGGFAAQRRARGRVATVAVTSFTFKQPISVGDQVSFYTRILHVGRTSITVDVEVFAERNPEDPVWVKVTEAQLVYVALDMDGSKRVVPAEPMAAALTHA